MVNISVELEPNPQGRPGIYYPGQRLAGVVQLSLHESKKFRGFYVLILGRAKCHWTERRTRSVGSGKDRRTESYTVSYDGKDVYLNSKTYLFGHHGAEAVPLAAGTYKYNFAVDLPPQIPASLSGSYGDIAYRVEAVLDIPWKFDKEIRVPFTVVRHDNLNDYPDLRYPLRQEEVKTFCCLFCASEPCLITVTIPYQGFAAGQDIPIKIEYVNKSNTDVPETRVKLKRTFAFTSSTPEYKTKHDTDKIVENHVPGCKGGESKTIECKLEIPSIMMNSNARFSRVVTLTYDVEVEVVVDGCHSNPDLRFPITIGSVGIGGVSEFNPLPSADQNGYNGNYLPPVTQPVYPPAPMPAYNPSAPSAPSMNETKEDLPPSFDEAMNSSQKPLLESSGFAQPQTSIGWSVPTVPSAPEKMKSDTSNNNCAFKDLFLRLP